VIAALPARREEAASHQNLPVRLQRQRNHGAVCPRIERVGKRELRPDGQGKRVGRECQRDPARRVENSLVRFQIVGLEGTLNLVER
jgi:hypothetical protein